MAGFPLGDFRPLDQTYHLGWRVVNNRPYGQISPTGIQLRAARAALGLSTLELAQATGLGVNTIRRAEAADGLAPITPANAKRLVEVLSARGISFLPEDAAGSGIRYRSPAA